MSSLVKKNDLFYCIYNENDSDLICDVIQSTLEI